MNKTINILETVTDNKDYTIFRVNLPDEDEALDTLMIKVQDMYGGDFSNRLGFTEVGLGKEMHPIIAEHELIKDSNSTNLPNTGLKCKFLFEKNYKVVQKPLTIKVFADGLPTVTLPNAQLITKPISDLILDNQEFETLIAENYTPGWFSIKKTSTKIKLSKRKYFGSKLKLYKLYKNNQFIFESTVKKDINLFMKNDANSLPDPSVIYHIESMFVTNDLFPLNMYDQSITKYNARLKISFISKKSKNTSYNLGWLFYVPK